MPESAGWESTVAADLLVSIVTSAARLLRADYADVYLYDAPSGLLRHAVSSNHQEGYDVPCKPGEGLAGTVFQSGAPLIVENYMSWKSRMPAHSRSTIPTTKLGLPLIWKQRTIGVLGLDADPATRTFCDEDVSLAGVFAEMAAVAIETARLYEELQTSMRKLKGTLEQELAERTTALARSALGAQVSAAGVAMTPSALSLDEMLVRVVELKVARKALDGLSALPLEAAPLPRLTRREVEVLGLIARGETNKEIAHALGISIKTVKTHVCSVLAKLQVQDRTQAAVLAVRLGLVSGDTSPIQARRET